jgi:hypothetical protein
LCEFFKNIGSWIFVSILGSSDYCYVCCLWLVTCRQEFIICPLAKFYYSSQILKISSIHKALSLSNLGSLSTLNPSIYTNLISFNLSSILHILTYSSFLEKQSISISILIYPFWDGSARGGSTDTDGRFTRRGFGGSRVARPSVPGHPGRRLGPGQEVYKGRHRQLRTLKYTLIPHEPPPPSRPPR